MGARGPKKKNRAIDALEGNPSRRKPKAATAVNDQAALVTAPPVPALLLKRKHAAELWQLVTRQLVARELLSDADLPALLVLCDTWQIYLDASEIASDPARAYFETESGYVAAHPAVNRLGSAAALLDKLWRKFGLTPVDREQLGVTLDTGKTKRGGISEFAAGKPKPK